MLGDKQRHRPKQLPYLVDLPFSAVWEMPAHCALVPLNHEVRAKHAETTGEWRLYNTGHCKAKHGTTPELLIKPTG